ncbi:MAG: ribosome-associated translation inhibitor RaiA [Rhodospirillales bacterium]|nr:ribosome-associated translation inhibitor RaiA [Alphaproteobacteria bacterium]USO03960.1 MAG: ribosome-associated translation inhibitor RaiA [Rhodospirillales bacterium]
MQLSVHGKQMDVGDALREHVTGKLEDISQKYFNHATDANVTFSPEGHGHGVIKTHISIRIGKDIMVIASAEDADPYASFDKASDKVAKQLRRYKKRLRDHHERLETSAILEAREHVISAESEDEDEDEKAHDAAPLVVAEMATNIQTMAVSEAVMRLNLSGQPAFLFRNANHNGLNMVYRREDGNVGWVDPQGNDASAKTNKKSA